MKDITNGALNIIMKRIVNCGRQLETALDEYSLFYWNLELERALTIKARIEKRFKMKHNVLFVDFSQKKRVA